MATPFLLESLGPLLTQVREVEREYAELDRKVFRFDGTLDELKVFLKTNGCAAHKYEEGDHSPAKWMLGDALEVWRVGGSFFIGTPKALKGLLP